MLGGTTYRALFEALSLDVGEGAVTWAMGRRVSLDDVVPHEGALIDLSMVPGAAPDHRPNRPSF